MKILCKLFGCQKFMIEKIDFYNIIDNDVKNFTDVTTYYSCVKCGESKSETKSYKISEVTEDFLTILIKNHMINDLNVFCLNENSDIVKLANLLKDNCYHYCIGTRGDKYIIGALYGGWLLTDDN